MRAKTKTANKSW